MNKHKSTLKHWPDLSHPTMGPPPRPSRPPSNPASPIPPPPHSPLPQDIDSPRYDPEPPPPTANTIKINTLEDLAKTAEILARPILHTHNDTQHTFYIIDETPNTPTQPKPHSKKQTYSKKNTTPTP